MTRPPVRIEVVHPHLWPRNTVERVSYRVVRWSALFLPVERNTLAHALVHIQQRERLGWRYLPLYIWFWVLAGGRHDRHQMENDARLGETVPFYLAWADELIEAHEATWEAA